MTNVVSLRTVAELLEGIRMEMLEAKRKGIMALENIRWRELTREQKLENLGVLAQVLMLQRLLETNRIDIATWCQLAEAKGINPVAMDFYVDCIAGGRKA